MFYFRCQGGTCFPFMVRKIVIAASLYLKGVTLILMTFHELRLKISHITWTNILPGKFHHPTSSCLLNVTPDTFLHPATDEQRKKKHFQRLFGLHPLAHRLAPDDSPY